MKRWAAMVAIAMVCSCGIPIDDSPRAADVDVNAGLSQKATTTLGDTTAYLYFVRNGTLVEVSRDVPSRDPKAVLDALFSGPIAAETANGMITQIPKQAQVESVSVTNGTIRIVASKELVDVIGSAAIQSYGQIVLTLTEISPSSTVEFVVDGKVVKVASPSQGDISRLSECDFVSLLPTDEQINEAHLSKDTSLHLSERRKSLTARCPNTKDAPS